MVYVTEDATWEYKILTCGFEFLPGEEKLNALGAEGWELTGILTTQSQAIYYFKRLS
jgi:hypothetical protein